MSDIKKKKKKKKLRKRKEKKKGLHNEFFYFLFHDSCSNTVQGTHDIEVIAMVIDNTRTI